MNEKTKRLLFCIGGLFILSCVAGFIKSPYVFWGVMVPLAFCWGTFSDTVYDKLFGGKNE